MRSKIINIVVLVFIIVWAGGSGFMVLGQDISKDELEKRALDNYQKRSYQKAMEDFRSLHNLFPKDSRISYYLGRSCLQANQNLDEACELLKFAAVRNYGEDTYFFLGQAYRMTYRFDDAEMAFATFKKTASNRMLKLYDIDYWIVVNRNAKELTVVAADIKAYNKVILPDHAPENAFADKINGKYVYVPDELKSKDDIDMNYQTLMYVPSDVKTGEYLFYASHSKSTNGSLDIFRVKRINAIAYSKPEALTSVINSPYDEDFPYYDGSTETLYFCSKGHSTSGGYDIFFTHVDSVTGEWVTPVKLPFPINTPFDDFLYTLTKDNSGAIFLSTRNIDNKGLSTVAYSIKLPGAFITPVDRNELLTLANIQSKGEEVENMIPVKNVTLQEISKEPKDLNSADKTNQKEVVVKSDYNKLLSEAMMMQARVDSINWSIKEMQNKADAEKDYRKKQELNANIITMEKESKRLQQQADERFSEAERIHTEIDKNSILPQTQLQENSKPIAVVTASAMSANKVADKNTVTQNDEKQYNKGIKAASVAKEQVNESFQILTNSPYSKDNPIPSRVDLPDCLVYRVQLGAFAGRVPENSFGGLAPLTAESIQEKNMTRYYVGFFSSLTDTRKALESIKKYGYPDAFIVSYYNRERIPIEKAKEIEFAEK
jgi:tetratricopeptide (TPR) repeat protein